MYALRKFASDYASCLLQFQWFCIFTFHQCNSLYFLRFWLFIHVKKIFIGDIHLSTINMYIQYTVLQLLKAKDTFYMEIFNITYSILVSITVYPIIYFRGVAKTERSKLVKQIYRIITCILQLPWSTFELQDKHSFKDKENLISPLEHAYMHSNGVDKKIRHNCDVRIFQMKDILVSNGGGSLAIFQTCYVFCS